MWGEGKVDRWNGRGGGEEEQSCVWWWEEEEGGGVRLQIAPSQAGY